MIQKMKKSKGFTLIEMLVVIAIIAVLVSIVIPVVGDSTEKAKEAADAANIRSAIAEVTTNGLTAASEATVASVTVDLKQSGDFDKAFSATDKIGEYPVSIFKNVEKVVVKWENNDIALYLDDASTPYTPSGNSKEGNTEQKQ